MGKTKKGKSAPHKKNPTGLRSLRDIENDEEAEGSGGPIGTIVDQLGSGSSDEKMCGLQALSTFCQREQNIQQIVNSELLRVVSPLLVDQDINVRHATAGALRNLSAISVGICEKMVDHDVFTPLLSLLNQYGNNEWAPTVASNLDQKSDTFLQAVNIVWNLCESTSVALEFFNQSQLLQSFVRCLNHQVFGMEIGKLEKIPQYFQLIEI
jgi:HEAT repeat-containing protein 3